MALHNHVSSPRTKVVCEIVVKIMSFVVIGNVLNKNLGISCLGMLYKLSSLRFMNFVIMLLMWLSLITWIIQRQMCVM